MKLIIFTLDGRGNSRNCKYPNRRLVTNADELADAILFDHVCAQYRNSYRSNDNFLGSNCIVMDCDNDHTEKEELWVRPEALLEELSDVAFAITYSRHHMIEKNGRKARPKFHVYFQIPVTRDAGAYKALKECIHHEFPCFDGNALDAGRFIFGCENKDVIWNEGSISIIEYLKQNSAFDDGTNHTIKEGSRNATMSRFAGRVVKRFGHGETAHQVFLNHAERCDPPLSDKELNLIWHSAGKFERKVQSSPGYIPPEEYNGRMPEGPLGSLRPLDYSDMGQAKVLVREYGKELRFTPATDFLRYNGSYWDENKEAAVGAVEEFLDMQLADAQALVFEAKEALKDAGPDPAILKAGGRKVIEALDEKTKELYDSYVSAVSYLNFVMKRRDYKYIKSALDTSKPLTAIDFKDLDKNGFLLNTPEATYDLRLGMSGRKEHDAADYITKETACEPGDEGKDIWLKALDDIFLRDQELIDYVQLVCGLVAVGTVYVEELIIAYGSGRNGKSSFWNTISKVLGTYSGNLSADTLTVGCRRNVKPELAEAKGKRLIIAAELEEGTRLNTSVVKQLCSTDPIFAEKKYKAPASFIPSHTTILYTNHLPKVSESDDGTWRRLIVIPFHAVFKGSRDKKNFSEYLVENASPAILQWIIEGARKAINMDFHLPRPQVVIDAIDAYRQENDWLSSFIEECCDVGESYEEKSGTLYDMYRAYSIRTGEAPRSTTDFYLALERIGYIRRRTAKARLIMGLKLKGDFDGLD